MTHVVIRYGRDGYTLTATGHAGTEKECIAVSAVIQALAGWVHNQHSGVLSLEKGEARIAFPKMPGAVTAMELTLIGLLQIEATAPESVKVEIQDTVPGDL